MNYCHWSLLRLAGFGADADLLLERMTRRLASGPAWEYLDPGKRRPGGGGAAPFSWNGLLLAMTESEVLDLGPERPQGRRTAS
jgi:hypothetical protein